MPTAPSRRSAALPAPAGRSPLAVALACAAWIALLPQLAAVARARRACPRSSSLRGAALHRSPSASRSRRADGGAARGLRLALDLIKPAIAFCASCRRRSGAHFMGSYGVVLDPTMMTNVLQTDPREVARPAQPAGWRSRCCCSRVLPLRLALAPAAARRACVAAGAGATAGDLARRAGRSRCCWCSLLFADLSATMRNHRSLRYLINPLNPSTRSASSRTEARRGRPGRCSRSAPDARLAPRPPGTRPPLLRAGVGETARADHFALNGYARPTNPELAQARTW